MDRRAFMAVAAGAVSCGTVGCSVAARSIGAEAPPTVTTDAAAFARQRRFVQTRFGRIAYVDRGRGPAALFLHGFPLNAFQWRGAIDRLEGSYRCIAPDFLGLGYTEVAEGQGVDPDTQVEMLVALLDLLEVESVHLVANDSGGAVAQLLAVRHPARVRTMLLTNCDVEPDSPPPAVLPVIELAKQGKFADAWLAPWVADKALARSEQGLGGLCYTYRAHPTDEAIDTYLGPLVASPRSKALTNAYAVALAPNPLAGISTELRRCRIPTRIVWGTGDTIFARESPVYLDRTLGNSRGVRYVEHAKLFFPEEFPGIVAQEARQLWRSV
jgi:haloalkane dehalogenase